MKMFESRVLRRIFGPKRETEQGSGGDRVTWIFMVCTATPNII